MSYSNGFIFGETIDNSSNCLKAILPTVYQIFNNPVEIGQGDTPKDLIDIPIDSPMGYGGQVDNRGNCFNLKLDITYWGGADCLKCNITKLSDTLFSVIIKKGDVFNIPAGYWSHISWSMVDELGQPMITNTAGSFSFYSSNTPSCPDCTPLVGQGQEPSGKILVNKK